MPVVVVTRLRLRDPNLLDEFFTHAAAVLEQATKSAGNLGVDALADAGDAWWSVSAWRDRSAIDAYLGAEPHLSSATMLNHFCDEASFVDWDQPDALLPDWQTSWRRLTTDGRSAELTSPSAANRDRDFPAPVEPPSSVR
jgi:quinol monooxygenase YgiN